MRQRQLPPHRQHGFVLILCLIILLVLTVLGVNNMNTSNLEGRMAENTQNKLSTFQTAETAIEDTFAARTDIDTAASTGAPVTTDHVYAADYTTSTTTTNHVCNPRDLTGYSISGDGKFQKYCVDIDATSVSAGTQAKSELVVGATLVAPNPTP